MSSTNPMPSPEDDGILFWRAAFWSAVYVVFAAVVWHLGAWLWGFRDADLAILFLYFASPTAAARFGMAKAVGGNHQLAAAIIVLTTLATVLTTNLGLFVLQWAGWI